MVTNSYSGLFCVDNTRGLYWERPIVFHILFEVCSSVCPSNIPVADIFRTLAAETQTLYNYEPGRDVSEPIPLQVFEEQLDEKKKN